MLEDLRRMSAIFDACMPAYSGHGPVQAYFAHQVEFSLCAFFGKLDVFQKRHFNAAAQGTTPTKESFALLLRDFKKQPVDDMTRAVGMLASYKMVERQPISPEEQNEIDFDFGWLIDEMPSTEKIVEEYFTKQRSGFNLGLKSHIIPLCEDILPDQTLSTFCAHLHYNPKMHLIGANLSGTNFQHDYAFFEGANFRGADLSHTQWDIKTTSIKGAYLEGADLRMAEGLTNEYLATAYIDIKTKLPDYLSRKEIQKLHNDLNMPAAKEFTELELKAMAQPKTTKGPSMGPK